MEAEPTPEAVSNVSSVLSSIFEPESLKNDVHLTQILARQQYVTIPEVANISVVSKTLSAANVVGETLRLETIIRACRDCPHVTLYDNDQYIIPKIPHNRTTLILRDLPEDATLKEIRQLLNNPNCGTVKEIKKEVNKTWFVTFATEEECVKSATWIQLNARLRGEKVRCRIKSEHQTKSYFSNTAPPAVPYADPSVAMFGPPVTEPDLNDPEFLAWLARNPQIAADQQPGRKQRKPKKRQNNRQKEQQQRPTAVQGFDENVDYDGIFKLITRSTFEMVVQQHLKSFPKGPEKPKELKGKHSIVARGKAVKGLIEADI